jgi:hypothetical protein
LKSNANNNNSVSGSSGINLPSTTSMKYESNINLANNSSSTHTSSATLNMQHQTPHSFNRTDYMNELKLFEDIIRVISDLVCFILSYFSSSLIIIFIIYNFI